MENLFKKHLKKLRIQNDISQKELAESLHLSKGVISSYESGKSLPNCQTLILIAHFFNVSIDYITGVTLLTTNWRKTPTSLILLFPFMFTN